MKLESTLPDKIGFLHVIPILDLLALLLMAVMIGPALLGQAGVQVELPVSRFEITPEQNALVVTLTAGEVPAVWLGREKMDVPHLAERLRQLREQASSVPVIYVRSDAGIPAAMEREVLETILAADFRVYLLGQPAPGR